ncbi:MAG: S41 family peptidase [Pyrinomonadaceae bacterium]|nr:S41 family peptidase [Pyrinomonadaceae bacterium]
MHYKQFVVAILLFHLLPSPSALNVKVAGQERTSPVGGETNASGAVERDFAETLTIIEDKYVDGSRLDYNTAFKSSIIGMLRALDPHSNYYDRQEFEELRTDQRSEYYGSGASISARQVEGNTDTYVITPSENSPAARAGLRFGDRIVEIGGEAMRGKSFAEVRSRLRGLRGSVIKVKVERAATKSMETVDVRRDVVPQPSIPSVYALPSGVGYIGLTDGFNTTTADELEVALADLQARNVRSLVLDLRDNPGGFVEQAVRVASKFLQRGQLVLTQKGRAQKGDRLYRSEEIAPVLLPLVVLVNNLSASASEIVAGALQDHDRALIVGENSFGKGLVQSIIPLEYGAGLTLTSAKYYTPSGRLIQRDYSNENLYDYYTRGNSNGANREARANPRASLRCKPRCAAAAGNRRDPSFFS